MTESVVVDFEGNSQNLIESAKKIQKEMDALDKKLDEAGVSQSAYNQAVREGEKAAQSSTMSWTDFRSMYSTVLDVVRVGQAIWDETAEKYVNNAVAVGNMARNLGTTTEEASRLKEVADDLGIGMDTLTTSFKLAQKDGFQPTVAGLADMADEYNKLAPGVERTQFLLDRFGKSGEDMGKLLEKGGESIRNMAGAVDESLIVTQQGYEEARRYQIAMDDLKDSWDGLTYKAAPPLIDAATKVLNSMTDSARAMEILKANGDDYAISQVRLGLVTNDAYQEALQQAAAEREQADAAKLAADSANEAGDAFESEAEKTQRLADEARVAKEKLDEMSRANQGLWSLTTKLQDEQSNYNETLAQTAKQYGANSQQVQDLKKKHEDAMKKIAFDLYLAKLQADGFTDAEFKMALQAGVATGQIDQATADMAQSLDKTIDAAINAGGAISEIGFAAQNASGSYDIHFNITQSGTIPDWNVNPHPGGLAPTWASGAFNPLVTPASSQAAGIVIQGDVIVYANDPSEFASMLSGSQL